MTPLFFLDNDGKGLRQRVRHYLLFSKGETAARKVQMYIDLRPLIAFAPTYLPQFLK